MVPCLVDPVGAEVANQFNSGLQHSSTLGAWEGRLASSALFLSLRDPVCFCCSCSGMTSQAISPLGIKSISIGKLIAINEELNWKVSSLYGTNKNDVKL